jgi:hypothetical protein
LDCDFDAMRRGHFRKRKIALEAGASELEDAR